MKSNFIAFVFLALACGKAQPHQSMLVVQERPQPVTALTIDSLDFKIGQMIMIGIGDITSLAPYDPLVMEIREGKAGGIVLYEKNISPVHSKKTLKHLISNSQKETQIPLFISIDEEGGKVHRLKKKYGFVNMPSASYLGELDHVDSTYYYTQNLAKLMAELGINLNYAPTVDLALNKENPVIAKLGRSYSDDPKIVSKHALASISAFHDHGIKTIIKHFPGHGSSSKDTHWDMADVTTAWKFAELLPYKEIIASGKCDAIMTAHIINCHLDPDCLPATLSKNMITGILRDFMGFTGVVFSDDMQMYAISKNFGLENAIKLAIQADVDVLMFANNVNADERVKASDIHAIIKKLVKSGAISKARIDTSYRRIAALKMKKYLL